jgi:HEAT repeat protein
MRQTIRTLALVLAASVAWAGQGDPAPSWEEVTGARPLLPPEPAAIGMLVKMLDEPDASVRERAAWCLGDSGAEKAAPPLLDRLKREESPAVRAQCARSLGVLKAGEAEAALVARLADESGLVRAAAARALGELGARGAAPALEKVAAGTDPVVARAAVRALAQLAQPSSAGVIATAARSEDPRLRLAALCALGRFAAAGGKVLPVLAEAVGSESAAERAAAAAALGTLGERKAVGTLAGLLRDKSPTVRRAAVGALARLGGASQERRIAAAAGDRDATVRREAAVQLGALKLTGSAAVLVGLFADPDPSVVDAALESFVALDPRVVTELAPRGLQSDNAATRRHCALALGRLKLAAGLERQIALLNDPDLGVRRASAWALGEIGKPAAAEPLMACLGVKGQDAEVRANALRGLGLLGHKPVIALARRLVGQKATETSTVRIAAIRALGRLGDRASIRALTARITDRNEMNPEDPQVQFEAVIALGRIGDRAALEVLRKTFSSDESEESLVRGARWGIEQITGEELKIAPDRFQAGRKQYFIHPVAP